MKQLFLFNFVKFVIFPDSIHYFFHFIRDADIENLDNGFEDRDWIDKESSTVSKNFELII